MTAGPKRAGEDLGGVARAVQQFYEQHPYPRPEDNLDRHREAWKDPLRRKARHFQLWPTSRHREDHNILVAGCGTFQAAKYAIAWPNAQVTGIDVSARSVEETTKLKHKYNLSNLELRQLSLEEAGSLDTAFDLIVCTGVLHHLPNPSVGLRALRNRLSRNGVMDVMVYAPFGRAGVYMFQEYCRLLEVGNSPSAIRDLAATLQSLPPDHPLVPLLRDAPDFRSYAGVADALLNPQDRAYSVRQFFDFVQGAGLRFGRWLRQAPYLPDCGSPASTPHADRLRTLTKIDQYSAMELFRGTMVRHSAILHRNDSSLDSNPISFEGEAWEGYVPLHLPETVSLQEKLPEGAAAALINLNHGYADLVLLLDATEKRLFDQIDAARTIGEIMASASASAQKTRALFQKLWLYDQVAFDASASALPVSKQ